VVIKQFQPPQKLLRAAANEFHDLRGPEKTVPVNEPDDMAVALREPHWENRGGALEAGKAGCHRATLPEVQESKKAWRLAI